MNFQPQSSHSRKLARPRCLSWQSRLTPRLKENVDKHDGWREMRVKNRDKTKPDERNG